MGLIRVGAKLKLKQIGPPGKDLRNPGVTSHLYSLPLDGRHVMDQNDIMFLFKVFEKTAEQVSYCVIDAEAVQFTACWN